MGADDHGEPTPPEQDDSGTPPATDRPPEAELEPFVIGRAVLLASAVAIVSLGGEVGTALTQRDYDGASILWNSLRSPPFIALAVVAGTVVAVVRFDAIAARWSSLAPGRSLRLLATGAMAPVTWTAALYPYNDALDRAHLVDRAIVLVAFAAAIWRPIFTIAWATACWSMINQFDVLVGTSDAESFQLTRVVVVIGVAAALAIGRRAPLWYRECVVVMLAVYAAGYWTPGVAKLTTGWAFTPPRVEGNLVEAHARGWLDGISNDEMADLLRLVESVGWLALVGTLVIEWGVLGLLAHRRVIGLAPFALLPFHLAIFGLTGIVFWRWAIFLIVLIVWTRRSGLLDDRAMFTRTVAVTAAGLIFLSPLWVRATGLGWLESPVGYGYEIEAVDGDGRTGNLDPGYFAPNDYSFAFSTIGFVSTEPVVVPGFGFTSDRAVADALWAAEDPTAVYELEQSVGRVRFDAARTAEFDELVRRTIRSRERSLVVRDVLDLLEPPPQAATGRRDEFDGESIVMVRVVEVTTFWDGERYDVIRRRVVHEIDV